jgi:phosphatidylglycerophosphate synthase
MMTYREAYDRVLPESKRKEEKYNILVFAFIRPISIFMTLPLVDKKVKPTTITKISIIFILVGFILIAFGQTSVIRLLGWLSIVIWTLLDGVDGNLARCTNQCSANGDLWDTTGGYLAMVCIYFSVGIAAFYDRNSIGLCASYWMLILGGATAVISIFPRLVMHKKKSAEGNTRAVKSLSDKKTFGLKNIIAMNFISPTGFMIIFLLLAIIFHLLNLFVIVYFFINFIVMMLSLHTLMKE